MTQSQAEKKAAWWAKERRIPYGVIQTLSGWDAIPQVPVPEDVERSAGTIELTRDGKFPQR
jgi:hypothetical protein